MGTGNLGLKVLHPDARVLAYPNNSVLARQEHAERRQGKLEWHAEG